MIDESEPDESQYICILLFSMQMFFEDKWSPIINDQLQSQKHIDKDNLNSNALTSAEYCRLEFV